MRILFSTRQTAIVTGVRRSMLGLAALTLVASGTGCSAEPTAAFVPTSRVAEGVTTDITVRWNTLARSLIVSAKPNQQEALRALAYLSLAQHEAALDALQNVVAISSATNFNVSSESQTERMQGDDPSRPVDRAALLRGAISGASVEVLKQMFRTSVATIDAALETEASALAQAGEILSSFWRGVDAGRAIGARIVAASKTDNFDAAWNGAVPTGPGAWFSSIGRPPLLPMLGSMRPFYMSTGSQFRPGPPPAFGSNDYQTALAEIRKFSDTRTPAQDSIAKFWAMATGTLVAGYWNEVATALIAKYHVNELRATHVLALMNTAAMDGNIACHDAKYTYWEIRPLQADPEIKTAIALPNHPSYPSNHACLSGAAALILANEFPAERAEMVRQAQEAVESRYYAGLHYRFDGDAGLAIARQVASLAIAADRDLSGKLVLR